MILVLDESGDDFRASIYISEALSDLCPVVTKDPRDLEAVDIAMASGVVLCPLEDGAFEKTLRLLEDTALNLSWKVVACLGPAAERMKARLSSFACPPAVILSYSSAVTPIDWRAIGIMVYVRSRELKRARAGRVL
jgi:hypothetical protein